jgi:hypothetical protein
MKEFKENDLKLNFNLNERNRVLNENNFFINEIYIKI